MIYIQFKEHSVLNKKENSLKRMIRIFFQFIFPMANPDFERKLKFVTYWLLEFKNIDSTPDREIGLGIDESVLLKMPYKNNHGYWVDNDLILEDFKKRFEVSQVSKEYFEEKWNASIG